MKNEPMAGVSHPVYFRGMWHYPGEKVPLAKLLPSGFYVDMDSLLVMAYEIWGEKNGKKTKARNRGKVQGSRKETKGQGSNKSQGPRRVDRKAKAR